MSAKRGRPRDAEVDRRVLDAVGRSLADVGYAEMSIDQIASTTGVAKTTIYRRWPTKAHLALAVIVEAQSAVPIPDTGDIRADLTTLTTAIGHGITALGGSLVAALAGAAAEDDSLGRSVRDIFGARRRAAFELIAAAAVRGELPADVDAARLVDLLAGPLYYRLLITGDPITPSYCRALVESALRSLPTVHKGE